MTAKDFRSASSVLFLFDFMLRGVGSRSRRTPGECAALFESNVCLFGELYAPRERLPG